MSEVDDLRAENERLTNKIHEERRISHDNHIVLMGNAKAQADKLAWALHKIDGASWKGCEHCDNSSEYAYEVARDALAEWEKFK